LAEKAGWTVVREFVVTESAKRGAERKAFNEMFQWVKANARREKIDAILSHKLDRVCRNMRDAVRLQDLEDSCDVRLAFVENQFGPGAAGALSFNVMAAVAQYYSDNLRSEVIKGMDEKVRQGWPTGLAPFGYLNVDDRSEPVIPHPERSKTLIRIFELYATGNYTLRSLAEKMREEGHVYRPSQPRFNRTALSYIMKNRFYVGELRRNGQIHEGKYRLLITPAMFEKCQDELGGKNRRTGNPDLLFSGCIMKCAHCGQSIAGEFIRCKLRSGGHNMHTYYRCGNNEKAADHPKLRWREQDLDAALIREFESFRMPSPEVADWFRDALRAAFTDVDEMQAQSKKSLGKRRTELENMQERLLNAYLQGSLDEATFNAKTADLKRQMKQVEVDLEATGQCEPGDAEMAVNVFDFAQNLPEIWRGSHNARKREILNCVSLNRTLSDVSLVLEKRRPFEILSERPFVQSSRGEPSFTELYIPFTAAEMKAA
jgi:DNA invertase Pin-like site-specific DNA recombinase